MLYRPPISVTGKPFTKLGRVYLIMLCCVLLGYALGGRGFAYWGFPPIYVGEIVLFIGIAALIQSGQLKRILLNSFFLPLILFMFWGLAQTLPYFERWGINAIRDAVIWGYAMFAIVTAGVLISVPERLVVLIKYYSRFPLIFLTIMPVLWVVQRALGGEFPIFPFTGNQIIEIKGGDTCVHLAGIFVYMVTMATTFNPFLGTLLIPLNLGMNIHGRSGMLSFMLGVFLASMLKPFSPRAWRIFVVFIIGLVLLWATDVRIKNVGGGRELSFDYLVQAISSVVSDKDTNPELSGTKEWRLKWWGDIIDYTIMDGKYFWTGKGFGVNLADDDGYQIDGNLRSPHNGHLTVLARSGVPGIVLWGWAHAVFAIVMIKMHLKARRSRDHKWAGLFLTLLAYWGALMCNATFDVFLEGPMGGIWLWSIYGIGIASAIIFKRYPHVLYIEPVDETPIPHRLAPPPAQRPSAGEQRILSRV